jgi:unspecific monooxygenase
VPHQQATAPTDGDASRAHRRPPGPPGRFLLGNTWDYERDRIGFLQDCQRRYGDVFSFDPSTIVLLDPELVHELFARTNTDFGAEVPIFRGVPPQAGAAVTPVAMAGRRKSWRGINRTAVAAHAGRLLDRFHDTVRGAAGAPVDVLALMKAFSVRAVTDYCLGPDTEDVAQAVERAAAATSVLMNSVVALPRWLPVPRVRRALRTERDLRAVLLDRARQRRRRGPADPPNDLLDTLLDPAGTPVDDTVVVDALTVLLRASHGVPGATLTWAIAVLARHPEIAGRLRAEAAGLDTARGVADLPYTEAFVKELLRAYPPTWLIGREVRTGTVLGGWHLRPGDRVMVPTYLIHRDPRWWTDPDRFRPDRWLTTTPPHARYAYLPFGAGPRICLGKDLGMLQLVLAVAALVRDYRVEVVNLDAAPLTPHALLVPDGLRARITPAAG